jgi:hypothetical protein
MVLCFYEATALARDLGSQYLLHGYAIHIKCINLHLTKIQASYCQLAIAISAALFSKKQKKAL